MKTKSKVAGLIVAATVCISGYVYQGPQQEVQQGAHHGESRSPHWPKVRAEHLKLHPECAACGQTDKLQVHHIIPFSFDPSKELDPDNLITLCVDGPGHMNCHLLWGHSGNYKCSGSNIRENCKIIRGILENKVCK